MILKDSPKKKKSMLRQWHNELNRLSEETGISFRDVCDYADITYNEKGTSFYAKIPHRRRTFIGVGMAYRLPLSAINDWITLYGGKKKLYAKDVSEDLIWIYLINQNARHPNSNKNYYRLYDKCQAVAFATWQELWDEITIGSVSTADVEIELEDVDYDDDFEGLKTFIIDHLDSFKTAYSKPRKYLDWYVNQILETCRSHPDKSDIRSISDLRGWLDDSMVNYLTGDSETVNVINPKSRKRTVRIKHVPKSKRTHIAMCLAMGMTAGEINEYLELMGYLPLSPDNPEEGLLITSLSDWEERFPLPGLYKKRYLEGDTSVKLTPTEELQAVEDMLMLRQTLRTSYKMKGYKFSYLKWE